ncbi:hypothetical protein JI75_08265 [Berryella intestinalis]|uniref:2-C-methyl-D-erythritol 4-phosphate cytidylyltransferase n=1 Tax=Berryella intestinalis TaxID=1531429 RepID=A0A0A8B586_9ACTN|nr:IspD/TarI family cytidylyltransferase [Berryella intestinalis]AJC12641.1 hypothetical protein JI75_08265 [Berryella intestinalis]
MNYSIILAGGVGQRMRTSGTPKQFLEVFGKPIVIYTLEKFEACPDVDKVIVACNAAWIDHMSNLLFKFSLEKNVTVVPGGKNRQASIANGIRQIRQLGGTDDDIVLVHDSVRPLVETAVISENIRVAHRFGGAMTVRPAIESACITEGDVVSFADFKVRDNTYTLTSPQTFRLGVLTDIYSKYADGVLPETVLDAAMGCSYLGSEVHMVKDASPNLKITTPEDFYIFKAMVEYEETKSAFGL